MDGSPGEQVTLFLMTEKGFEVLRAVLSAHPHAVAGVVAARDPNVRKDYYDEISELCVQSGVPFSSRADRLPITTRTALAISWRWLITDPGLSLIVFHDSLLPRYRGFNPLVSALLNGDERVGVTALYANKEYDRGDIIDQSATDVHYPIRLADAITLINQNYRELALRVVGALTSGVPLEANLQNEADATYSLWRDEEDYRIDWSRSAPEIRRFVDAVGSPYRGASTELNGKLARVLRGQPLDDIIIENRCSGKVIFVQEQRPVVVCGSGLFRIDELTDDTTNTSLLPLAQFRSRFR